MINYIRYSERNRETAVNFSNRIVCLLCFLVFLLSGCGTMQEIQTNIEDIKISSHMQKQQHHELIRTLQPMLDRGETLSSFRVFLLVAAYYEIRDYEKMFKTADLLEKQIRQVDIEGYGGDLTVYPQIYRGYAYLDQGSSGKALKEANEALAMLKDISRIGLVKAIERGYFANIKRGETGGKGLEGVVEKAKDYYNPFINRWKKNRD